MRDSEDLALLDALRRGQPAAFNRIYDAYRARLFGFLLRLSGRRAVAEELLQETFLRLAKMSPRLRDDTNFRALLFTIARNAFLSWARWQSLDFDRLHDLSLWPPPAPPASPLERLSENERQRQYERALSSLSLADREILLLVGVEGLEPSAAAEVLEISAEAARKRLERARDRLAQCLADAGAAAETFRRTS